MVLHLLPTEGEEPYHLDYETIEAFIDDKLAATDRSTAKLHLEDCAECSAEVEDLRESLATMRATSREVERKRAEHRTPQRHAAFAPPMRIAAMVAFVLFAA